MSQTPELKLEEAITTPTRHETEIEIVTRLFRVGSRLRRWTLSRTREVPEGDETELSLAQLTCLYHIREGVETPGELAKILGVTPTAVTALVDRLVRRGYVAREHDTVDRRRVILAATNEGNRAGDEALHSGAESLASMMNNLDDAEVNQIWLGLRLLDSAFERVQPLTESR
jgi:DNA-binding MarR family transcriptional regulator